MKERKKKEDKERKGGGREGRQDGRKGGKKLKAEGRVYREVTDLCVLSSFFHKVNKKMKSVPAIKYLS